MCVQEPCVYLLWPPSVVIGNTYLNTMLLFHYSGGSVCNCCDVELAPGSILKWKQGGWWKKVANKDIEEGMLSLDSAITGRLHHNVRRGWVQWQKVMYQAKKADVQRVPNLAKPCVRSCEAKTCIKGILELGRGSRQICWGMCLDTHQHNLLRTYSSKHQYFRGMNPEIIKIHANAFSIHAAQVGAFFESKPYSCFVLLYV